MQVHQPSLPALLAKLRPTPQKNTVNIPMKTTARCLGTFADHTRIWMIHCHILDHADGGLMGTVQGRQGRHPRASRPEEAVAASGARQNRTPTEKVNSRGVW